MIEGFPRRTQVLTATRVPAFNFHHLLSAARLVEAPTPTPIAGTLSAGVAVQFASEDAPAKVARSLAALEANGGRLTAVSLRWDVRHPPEAGMVAQWIDAIGQHCDLLLLELVSSDIHDKPSAPRALPIAAPLLHLASRLAGRHVRIALLPRPDAWMSDEQDAVRLAMRVNRGNVGVALNWNLGRDGQAPSVDLLRLVEPKLMAVTWHSKIGSNTDDMWKSQRAQDLLPLERMGYRGPVFVCADEERK